SGIKGQPQMSVLGDDLWAEEEEAEEGGEGEGEDGGGDWTHQLRLEQEFLRGKAQDRERERERRRGAQRDKAGEKERPGQQQGEGEGKVNQEGVAPGAVGLGAEGEGKAEGEGEAEAGAATGGAPAGADDQELAEREKEQAGRERLERERRERERMERERVERERVDRERLRSQQKLLEEAIVEMKRMRGEQIAMGRELRRARNTKEAVKQAFGEMKKQVVAQEHMLAQARVQLSLLEGVNKAQTEEISRLWMAATQNQPGLAPITGLAAPPGTVMGSDTRFFAACAGVRTLLQIAWSPANNIGALAKAKFKEANGGMAPGHPGDMQWEDVLKALEEYIRLGSLEFAKYQLMFGFKEKAVYRARSRLQDGRTQAMLLAEAHDEARHQLMEGTLEFEAHALASSVATSIRSLLGTVKDEKQEDEDEEAAVQSLIASAEANAQNTAREAEREVIQAQANAAAGLPPAADPAAGAAGAAAAAGVPGSVGMDGGVGLDAVDAAGEMGPGGEGDGVIRRKPGRPRGGGAALAIGNGDLPALSRPLEVYAKMVQYGRYLLSHRVPGWEPYYLNYKSLKKEIRAYEAAVASGVTEEDVQQDMARRFSERLDSQMEKVVLFFLEQQGVLAGKLQRLREQREGSNTRGDESGLAIVMSSDFSDMMEQYRDVGRELLQLLQFVEMNATGLRKILKKFDRRVGVRLGHTYIASRTLHPYSHLQQIFKQVGLGAMVGTIIRNLDELHRRERCFSSPSNLLSPRAGTPRRTSFSLFRQGDESPVYVAQEEPIIQEIEAARAKLTDAVSYSTYMAKGLLLPPAPERGPEAGEPEFHWWSLQLNQFNTFLYMVNYYIIVPTSDEYAVLLSAPPALCGIIIGATPLCALVSAFIFSKWSNTSYTQPLLVSTIVLLLGNFAYAAALDFNSVALLLIGRSLTGLGGVRAINRRYIADHVPSSERTSASAGFVSAGALGMAAGPFAASLIDFLNFKFLGFTVNSVTSPGWLMVLSWLLYLLFVVLFFKEPDRTHLQPPVPAGGVAGVKREKSGGDLRRRGSKEAALGGNLKRGGSKEAALGGLGAAGVNGPDIDEGEDEEDEDDDGASSTGAVETLPELMKELSRPISVLLFMYFMIKFATEVLISESSLISKFYFQWTINDIGWFLGLLGLTVLPISSVVGNYITNIYEDRLVIMWTQGLIAIGVIAVMCFAPIIKYTTQQYIVAAVIIFVSCNVLEGVSLSLMSRIMSPRLARGTSVGIIMINKQVMSGYGFRFASTLTGLHFAVTALVGMASAALGYLNSKNTVPLWELIWFSIVANLSIVAMNLSLMLNTVGFYQIAKLSIIPVVCFFEALLHAKSYSREVKFSVAVVMVGVGVCTVTDINMNAFGFIAATVAVISTSLQQIFIGSLQTKYSIGSFDLLSQTAPIQAALLLLLGPVIDYFLISQSILKYQLTWVSAIFIGLSCFFAVFCNLSQYLCIGKFSATSFQVLGHMKTVLVLAMGFLIFSSPITLKNVMGMLMAVVGMVLYSWAVEKGKKEKEARDKLLRSPVVSAALPTKLPDEGMENGEKLALLSSNDDVEAGRQG
ncbi:unnamed protein product, partial [Closterium sp. Yama58-4]